MEFRSSNSIGYVHYQGDIVSNVSSGGNVNSSHGVQLTGGSTGGIVTAAGDEANVAVRLIAKGAGPVLVGNSSQAITLGGSGVSLPNSTTFINLFQRSLLQFTVPALSSAGAAGAAVDSTVTLSGATTSAFYLVQQREALNSTSDPALFVKARCSSADELKLSIFNTGPSSLSGSTVSMYLLRIGFA